MKRTAAASNARNAIAEMNRVALRSSGVFTVSVTGGPGCGKTCLIEETIRRLVPRVRIGVVACNMSSHVDVERKKHHCDQEVHVSTGVDGIAEAALVQDAIRRLDLSRLDVLFIKDVGTMIGPFAPDVGQDLTVAMFSVAGGDDNAEKRPELVRAAGLVLLNKIDLLAHVQFDLEAFRAAVHRLNPASDLLEVSASHGTGLSGWVEWIESGARKRRCRESPQRRG
jgi:hydrogenase nickel incorporation protein HypB